MKEQELFHKEWRLPSRFGAEKEVWHSIKTIAADWEVGEEKLDGMLTAVTEACLNAMEHGNRGQAELPVVVTLRVYDQKFVFRVQDRGANANGSGKMGEAVLATEKPFDAKRRLAADWPRGWGLFLINQLTDRVCCGIDRDGSYITLIFHLT